MRSRLGRGRGGPGLLGTMARTAVVAGTASSVAGRVSARQQAPVPPQRAAPSDVDQLPAQPTELGELRQAGLLTEEEFAAQKDRLLQA
ncbi:SHOCT domain-containing protein [Geodermatophilus sp. CPCC 206100]|uniref:SHOCT domain-containing protein n=1 Tax=Geodermatophilus sp. CPCC 206100 TaxID=3020054 RepID=UPI003B000077